MTVVAMTEAPKAETHKKDCAMEKLMTLSSLAFASFGALLNLVGVCILQSNLNRATKLLPASIVSSRSYHLYDTQWFHTFFYIAVIIVFGVISMMGKIADHRLTLMAFLTIGFVYLTVDMGGFIDGTRSESGISGNSNFTVGGPATAFAGCFFMILAWFAMIIQTGGIPSGPFFSK